MKVLLSALAALALLFGASISQAYNDLPEPRLAYVIAEKVCGSPGTAYSKGCFLYMCCRLGLNMNKSGALNEAKNLCSWSYATESDNTRRCLQGAEYLFGLE